MEYECRKLMAGDLDMVMNLNRDYWDGFIYRKNAEEFLSDPKNWLYAAVGGSCIIGFVYGYELKRLNNDGNMLYIHGVEVMEQYRRSGIGFRMMSELKQECCALGFGKLFLVTGSNNTGANALYRELGGQICEESHGEDVMYFFRTK
jgi:ribosomal protein S18 acetylase RimI-like enzyme